MENDSLYECTNLGLVTGSTLTIERAKWTTLKL